MQKNKSIPIRALIVAGSLSLALYGCGQNVTTHPENNTSASSESSQNEEVPTQKSEIKETEKETNLEVSETVSESEVVETMESENTDDVIDPLTDTQHNSINMLNYLTVLTQEINSSKNSKLYLEQAYSSIVNNTYPNAIDDRTLGELNALLDTLEGYRMVAEKRERIEYIYEQNKAQALRDAVPNPLGLISTVQSFSLAKMVASVAYMTVDSVTSYQTSSAQADLQYLQDGWALDDEDAEFLHNQRKSTFSYMVKTVNENKLPGELTLTEESVDTFVDWKNNPNVVARIRFLESNQNTYMAFGGYWLTLAQSYYENQDYEKCLDAIKSYENLEICIFRKDYDYAETLPYVIAASEEVLDGSDYISNLEHYAENIINNTGNDQWSLRYIAAQAYIELYAKTNDDIYLRKAYDIALDNVNNLVSKQQSMNDTFLTEVVKAKAEKGDSSDKKDEIKKYNKLLKEERKTELPPTYEPLMLNCDLLFSLTEKLDLSAKDMSQIEQILHENNEKLFLVEELDNLYRFSSNNIDTSKIDISFDGEKLIIPAKYVSESTKITVTIKEKNTKKEIDDWSIDKVTRKTEKELDTFKAIYSSETAKKFKYSDDMEIDIEIDVKPDSGADILEFKYKTELQERWGIIPDKLTYQRVEK